MQHHARKRFGQHFLQDNDVIDRIIAATAPQKDQHIVEIGPGFGALTYKILPQVLTLDVLEIDRDLAYNLQQQIKPSPQFNLHITDALGFDFTQLIPQPLRIVGNLPYNISTPLLFHLLQNRHIIQDMHFMLQKEVVERIIATPKSKNYGRLSVMLQYHYNASKLFTVAANAFTPRPKVDSAILRLVPHRNRSLIANDATTFSQVVKLAFTHPRKMLSSNLQALLTPEQLHELSIAPTQRPGELSVADYVTIANYFTAVNQQIECLPDLTEKY